ncbi:MAG: hypothetical protein BAJALOKI2v1_190050 [Promethearchaeota archaeon]|nr:MAG: hypothetical protein BAJALOKI2v1_190050 [Candidatus Lokiarchaeota archaeon]
MIEIEVLTVLSNYEILVGSVRKVLYGLKTKSLIIAIKI